jgi:pyridoxal phosphate enzyme (YggS family)
MAVIAEKLKQIQDSITSACGHAGRKPQDVRLIVVTKTASVDQILEVIRAGFFELGENRVQHLKQIADQVTESLQTTNQADLASQVQWHMIGHLQRNKVKPTLQICTLVHSVDTLRLAEEIDTAAEKLHLHIPVLLQVNCSNEPQKYGAPVGAAIHLAEQITSMPNLRLEGLMTMAPLTMDKEVVRSCFARARELFEELKAEKIAGSRFRHLSMGMSQDYEIAIEMGATMLRIGSAIFA